jgi:kinesin family protein 1/kinesin family protein 3/17
MENIRVAVRCRPLNSKEEARGEGACLEILEDGVINITAPADAGAGVDAGALKRFKFDYSYGPNCEQEQVAQDIAFPILEAAFDGFNGTIFAYGQTGSGKTHSMAGVPSDLGIIPRLNRELFARIEREKEASPGKKFLVVCSYFEIYNEMIRDLLDPASSFTGRGASRSGLQIKEHKVKRVVDAVDTVCCL